MRSKLFFTAVGCLIINLCSAQYTKLFDFENPETGIYPEHAALISDGTYLYGTASNGGNEGDGTIFKIKRDGTDFQKLYDFTDTTADVPESGVILIDGYLYGTTKYGGEFGFGTVYRIKTDGTDFSVLANFDRVNYGSDLMGSLYFDGTFLYGMASIGGINNGGTIYKLKTDGSGFTTILNFSNGLSDGSAPWAHLISDGTYLYGMTTGGGSANQGVAFKVKPDGSDYTVLVEFTDDPTGSWGYGGMVYDGTEYLYAMTNNGGEYNRGTIFKVKTDGTGYEKLLDMNNTDGAQPLGSLVLVGTTLYGLTELGAEDFDGMGNMFSIETDGTNFTNLIDFDGDNGSYPYGTLLYEDGAFFGMTSDGGANSFGTIFRYGDIVESTDEKNISALNVFPNPADDYISLSLPQTAGKKAEVQLINSLGEIVLSDILLNGNDQLNISFVKPGFYSIIATQEQNTFVSSVVIQ